MLEGEKEETEKEKLREEIADLEDVLPDIIAKVRGHFTEGKGGAWIWEMVYAWRGRGRERERGREMYILQYQNVMHVCSHLCLGWIP